MLLRLEALEYIKPKQQKGYICKRNSGTDFAPAEGWTTISVSESELARRENPADTIKGNNKTGFLSAGNDIAAGISRADAEAMVLKNPCF